MNNSNEDRENVILQGDCLEIMRTLPDEYVDLVVTSPPYNLRSVSGGITSNGQSLWKSNPLKNGYDSYDDNMPHADYVEWQRAVLTECMRLIPDDGAIFYNHKWRIQNGLLQDRTDIVSGFPVRQVIIWDRGCGINFNDNYFLPTYEVIYLIAKKDFKLAPKACTFKDIWRIKPESNNVHPAPFPLELAERCISATTAEFILDPFSGSGTTARAAKNLGRKYLGIELSEKYCEMARNRVNETSIMDFI
jgi:modification methylase